MTNDSIRDFCLALPMVTEEVQWGEHLLFKIGGKMFCILTLGGQRVGFKSTPEHYGELVEIDGIEPSSHNMWKYQWVTMEPLTVLRDAELREALEESYRLVRATLTKKAQAELDAGRQPAVKKWVPKAERTKAKERTPKKTTSKRRTAAAHRRGR